MFRTTLLRPCDSTSELRDTVDTMAKMGDRGSTELPRAPVRRQITIGCRGVYFMTETRYARCSKLGKLSFTHRNKCGIQGIEGDKNAELHAYLPGTKNSPYCSKLSDL